MAVSDTSLRYAGPPEDKTVTVTGELAKLVMSYADKPEQVGIRILEVKS